MGQPPLGTLTLMKDSPSSKTLVPVEEEEEEMQSGRRSPDSSQGEPEMVLFPLLSPDEETGSSGMTGIPSSPPPLFLTVTCALRDSNGCHAHHLNMPHCITTCLSEYDDVCSSLIFYHIELFSEEAADADGSLDRETCYTVSVELVFSSLSQVPVNAEHAQHRSVIW